MFTRKNSIYRNLKKNPSHMYVDDNIIAVMMPHGELLVIKGDFKGITAEEANLKLQNVLEKFNME